MVSTKYIGMDVHRRESVLLRNSLLKQTQTFLFLLKQRILWAFQRSD